jgi:uncharacterized paraquat-inducible protein A
MENLTNHNNNQQTQNTTTGVLCAKCEHLNPASAELCEKCGAHLYIACTHCGRKNKRVDARCYHCHHRLHHSKFHRLKRKLIPKNWKSLVWQAILLLVASFIVYKIVVMIANYSP